MKQVEHEKTNKRKGVKENNQPFNEERFEWETTGSFLQVLSKM